MPQVPLIALKSFSPGTGMIRAGESFLDRPRRASLRVEKGLAAHDATEIDGVDQSEDAVRLGRLFPTLEDLRDASASELLRSGASDAAVEAVMAWQDGADAPERPEPKPDLDNFTDIPGIGKKGAEELSGAGIESFDALRAIGEDAIADALSGRTLSAVQAWREKQGENDENDDEEPAEKGVGPEENKSVSPAENKAD